MKCLMKDYAMLFYEILTNTPPNTEKFRTSGCKTFNFHEIYYLYTISLQIYVKYPTHIQTILYEI